MLTSEQQHALDTLFAHVPKNGTAVSPAPPGFLQTWFGLSENQLKTEFMRLLAQKDRLESHFLDWVERNPMDSAFTFLATAAAAFYAAEKGENSEIQTYVDAFYYISTCASVGYADVFAVTQPGKAIAALVMIVGPALAAKALDRPKE